MPLETGKNKDYGPPLVTEKYSPLQNINFTTQTKEFFGKLLSNRKRLLMSLGLLPKTLNLVVPNWDETVASEAGMKPPLVVVSSNRSKWIKAGIDSAASRLAFLGLNEFDNASDLRALAVHPGHAFEPPQQSPPIYCPSRIGPVAGPRNVYVVVHLSEYFNYQILNGPGITVVGWSFVRPGRRSRWISGFGASRFAAIQFCKTLRTEANDPWDYAWLIDDNAVAFTSFHGYDAIEGQMTPNHVCAGLKGGTEALPFSANKPAGNKEWAAKELNAGRGTQQYWQNAAPLVEAAEKGVLQQAVLWNIAYLTENHLNFAPTYIESAEDTSIGYYFASQEIPFRYYSNGVRKELVPKHDDTRGAMRLIGQRRRLTKLFVDREGAAQGANPPPPIRVKPKDETGACKDQMTLAEYVVNCVLPAAQKMAGKVNDPATQDAAKCQAVEQITARALEAGAMHAAAANGVFKFNGNADQAVERLNKRINR